MRRPPDPGRAAAPGGNGGGRRISRDSGIGDHHGTTGVRDRTTLYMLTSPATDSWENLEVDAERRARERGCQCIRATFRHYLNGYICTTVVDHAAWCPLSGVTS